MDRRLAEAIEQLGQGEYKPGSSGAPGWIYNPIPFPGCEDIPCHRPNSHERWRLITRHCDLNNKTVLDWGCATGYFSFMAAQAGAEAFGYDADPAAIRVCRAVEDAFEVQGVHFSTDCGFNRHYDVVLALSVLNWMGKEQAEAWLARWRLIVGEFYVEIPYAGDALGGADWLTCDEECRAWLQEQSGYAYVDALGQTRGPHQGHWRTLWRCASVPTVEPLQFAVGQEAEVLLYGEQVVWLANGVEAHPESAIGWRLCAQRLKPPNFPHIYAVAITEQGGCPQVYMERVEGEPPTEWNEEQAGRILAQLEAANIEHRDLRLENIIQRPTGEWCLIDFGWACEKGAAYPVPDVAGNEVRPPGGPPNDRYAMMVVRHQLQEPSGPRLFLIYPGATWSPIDIATGMEIAFRQLDWRVHNFHYHTQYSWYRSFLSYIASKYHLPFTAAEAVLLASEHAAIGALDYWPDVILNVMGVAFHKRGFDLFSRLPMPHAIVLTESPYMDDAQGTVLKLGNVQLAFTNDRISVGPLSEASDTPVVYLPHSFDPLRHYPRPVDESRQTDVFFHGTAWPKRRELFGALDLSAYKAHVVGVWIDPGNPDAPPSEMDIVVNEMLPNDDMAIWYSNTKIALNHHRHVKYKGGLIADAYSLGPRAYEIAACGAFQLCDDTRPELAEVFGDSVATYHDAADLQDKIGYYLAHDAERVEMAAEAHRRVQACSFTRRVQDIVIPALERIM